MKKLSRKKRKDPDTEQFEHEIRALKSTIRSLQRRLRKVDKGYVKYKADKEEKPEKLEPEYDCENCGKGMQQVSTFGPRKVTTCDNCDFRKIEKV